MLIYIFIAPSYIYIYIYIYILRMIFNPHINTIYQQVLHGSIVLLGWYGSKCDLVQAGL